MTTTEKGNPPKEKPNPDNQPMKTSNFLLLAALLLSSLAETHAGDTAEHPSAVPTRPATTFGTLIWGRNCTGQPHWMDGSIFPGLDGQSRLENMLYVPLDPDGKPAATTSDPKVLKKGRYDCALLDYWVDQARQMSAAGLDWVGIDSFGDRHDWEDPNAKFDPKQSKYVIPSMVKGIRVAGVKLKICLMDDTPSHTNLHYRFEQLRQLFPGTDERGNYNWLKYRYALEQVPTDPLPVSADMGRKYLAEKWVNAYRWMEKDKDLWLTHNGAHPDQGGRPVIFMYGVNESWMQKKTMPLLHEAFAAAKNEFKQAFGMEPFLILADSYFKFDRQVEAVADGKWIWTPIAPKTIRPRKCVFTNPTSSKQLVVGMVSPGFELKSKTLGHTEERRRSVAMDGTTGDEKHLLVTEFGIVMSDPKPDYVLIGHWNDFQEGQNFGLAVYPTKDGKGFLPPDYYLKAVRELIDATRILLP